MSDEGTPAASQPYPTALACETWPVERLARARFALRLFVHFTATTRGRVRETRPFWQPTWREGLRAALAELLEFCADQPAVAKALLVEAHAAGPRALAQRRETMERLARALDSGRGERPASGPPAIAPDFVVGAIDTLLAAKLMDGEAASAPEMLPGLLHFVVMQYPVERKSSRTAAGAATHVAAPVTIEGESLPNPRPIPSADADRFFRPVLAA